MAFTAMHYPVDKDKGQIAYWPDNDDFAVAGDNFFDQFVTFDTGDPTALGGGDLHQNPPSPSILLDSLDDSLTNSSSNDQDTQPGLPGGEVATTAASDLLTLPSQATTTEQSNHIPDVLTTLAADPILSNGSISDSELLRLEGISLKSPNTTTSAPSSPPFASTASPSPRKHNRFVESLYATFRRATHRPKQNRQQDYSQSQRTNLAAMDIFQGDMNGHHGISGMNDYTEHGVEIKPEPIDSNGFPLSPPLTGRIPPGQTSNTMPFVNGHFDDPFCEDLLAPPATINPARGPDSTPIDTPVTSEDMFYQQAMASLDPHTNSYRRQPKPQRSTSSAEWPMEGILTDDMNTNLWSTSTPPPTAYIPDGSGSMPKSSSWWESPHAVAESGMQQQPSRHRSEHNLHSHSQNHAQTDGGIIRHASSLNFSLPPAPHHHPPPPPPPPATSHHHHYGGHHTERRPRPRAPSSGARHHGSLTSPRKLHHSSSRPYLREESASPTPSSSRHSSGGGGHAPQPRSSSISVRKRRSWCRRESASQPQSQQTPQTPSTPSFGGGTTIGGNGGGGGGGGGGGVGGGGGGGGRGGGIDFVNFTPSDKNVLMTGVAPSGSSKTKARREKEALEKSRKLSEAAMRAIRAAGGNVDKLVEGGFVI
ncbi:hypothetical protein F5X99DRAFT_408599 [Biscogniauxia marginata]|nr:hypothetical protein F5X99DRAFT_408599 [Biscogniauxia marginata]